MLRWAFLFLPLALFAQPECYTTGEPIELPTYRTNDFKWLSVVVHVIHRGEAYGNNNNIRDEQILSGIESINAHMRDNPHGDTRIRVRLAYINRTGWNQIYNDNGCGYYVSDPGIHQSEIKAALRDPDHYNIYLVWSICANPYPCNWGGAGVQGWAMFPATLPQQADGIVQLINTFGARSFGPNPTTFNLKTYTDQNKTTIHELGHGLNLYHTFQSTNNCTSETNCVTQGDRCCDTPPHNETNACPSITCDPAPVYNHMSYSPQSCRVEFTPCQTDRMRAAFDLGSRSGIGGTYPTSSCPGDVCQDALYLPLCQFEGFGNVPCNHQDYYAEGMSSFVGNCVNTLLTTPCPAEYTHHKNQWFYFNWLGGTAQMTILSNYSCPGVPNSGNFGPAEGVVWTLWSKQETCMQSFVVIGSSCNAAAYCNPGIVTYANGMHPYDPTRQNWDVTFDLPAGEYYIELMGFSAAYQQNGQNVTCVSTGTGQVMVCGLTPLALPPVLRLEGRTLKWSGEAYVYRAENDWVEVAHADSEYTPEIGGIYCVGNAFGLSNYVHVKSLTPAEWVIIGIDGKQGARFGVAVPKN